ncbi:MAG: hypothetical protein L0I24_01260 [Pseudonocardia sp.]|nr:hypothetical protein [Pseudonocardia sp.]
MTTSSSTPLPDPNLPASASGAAPAPEPNKAPLLGHRSFTIIAAAIGAGILAYPVGGWFAAVAGALMIAATLHALLGS